jgi:hypothetical protein
MFIPVSGLLFQQKVLPMPNNQDTVKLLPCPFCGAEAESYHAAERKPHADGSLNACWIVDCSECDANLEGCGYRSQEEAEREWNTRAPTPREQELEAQNKALWELVWKADDALQGMVSLITVNTVAGGKIPSIFADDTRVAWAIEAREAIQKAKEAR